MQMTVAVDAGEDALGGCPVQCPAPPYTLPDVTLGPCATLDRPALLLMRVRGWDVRDRKIKGGGPPWIMTAVMLVLIACLP